VVNRGRNLFKAYTEPKGTDGESGGVRANKKQPGSEVKVPLGGRAAGPAQGGKRGRDADVNRTVATLAALAAREPGSPVSGRG